MPRLPAVAALVLVLAPLVGAQKASDVHVGHWVRLKGQMGEDGVFRADYARVSSPESDEAILGTIAEVKTDDRFLVLGQEVHFSSDTKLEGVTRDVLLGARVKIEGDYKGPRNFSADEIEARKPGRDRIEGRVDLVESTPAGLSLRVMNFTVLLPNDLELDQEESLGAVRLAPRRILGRQKTQFNDDDDFLGRIRLTPDITLGGQIEWKSRLEDDYNLDADKREDVRDHRGSARIELTWVPRDDFYFLTGVRHRQGWEDEQDRNEIHRENTVLVEAFGYFLDVFGSGLDIQVGRQDFDERREWLYDQFLDGVRLIFRNRGFRTELSATTTFANGSRRDQDSTNLIAYVSNNDWDRHLAGYAIGRLDNESAGDYSAHVGGRMIGEWVPRNDVWSELSLFGGEIGSERLLGIGFDVGTTWYPLDSRQLYLTAGYAFGSGDSDPADGTNNTFRQTGLQDNNARFGGVTSFRYYGEIVDPELANLGIATLGIGGRPTRRTSLDLVFHKYDQAEAANRLIDSDLDARPDGIHRDIGWEIDLIFGSRQFQAWQFEVIVGHFEPGNAFASGDSAQLVSFQVRYKF